MREYFNPVLGRWIVRRDDGTPTYRYRFIIEQEIGRRLRTDEHVHHVNGNPTDDRLENLVVMGKSEHHRHHGALARKALALNPGPWARDYPCCIECGTTERKHAGHGECTRCYFRNRARRVYGHAPRRAATVIVAVCPECGKEFSRTSKQGRSTYCSKPCSVRATAQQRWATRRARAAA